MIEGDPDNNAINAFPCGVSLSPLIQLFTSSSVEAFFSIWIVH